MIRVTLRETPFVNSAILAQMEKDRAIREARQKNDYQQPQASEPTG